MACHFELKQAPQVPLEVEGIVPAAVRDLSLDAICKLPVFHGNRSSELGEFFQVRGDPTDGNCIWEGDLSGVHWLGAKMREGTIVVRGPVGRHLGSEMAGGQIDVHGDASDWVGAELHGGRIHIHGSAGHLVGAAYRGSRRGMTAGIILVDGSVGNEVGMTMRRGLLAVGGDAGDLLAMNMLAGTVAVAGNTGIRASAGMHRGTLILAGPTRPELLPTFRRATTGQPLILQLIFRTLRTAGFEVTADQWGTSFDLYHGDMIQGGRGEVFVRAD